MNRWAIYTPDGRIDRIYSGPAQEAAIQAVGNEGVLPLYSDLDDSTAYVSAGEVAAKQVLPLVIITTQITADGIDEALITGIPSGTTIQWPDGQVDTITDGEVGFKVDLEGTYTLKLSAVPYLDKGVVIEALPAA